MGLLLENLKYKIMDHSKLITLFEQYGSMSFSVGEYEDSLKNYVEELADDAGVSTLKEFGDIIDGNIDDGADVNNEKELVLTVLIYELWLSIFDEFDDSEIVTVKYNDETLIEQSIEEIRVLYKQYLH